MTHRTASCPELPAPPGRIVLFALIALATGLGLAWWIERPTGPTCKGVLAARTTYVTADCEGTLAEFSVEQGSMVSLGDPLVVLSEADLETELEEQRHMVASLQSELDRVQAAAKLELDWRNRTIDADICNIQLRAATYLREKFDSELQKNMMADVLAGEDLVMLNEPGSLYESVVIAGKVPSSNRMITALEMEAAANRAEVSGTQLEICELQQKQLQKLKSQLPEQINRSMGVDAAQANLQRAEAALESMEAEREDLTIASPAIGKVGVFKVRRGDHLVPGTPIVELLDDAQRYLVVHVPSKSITHFNIGTQLKLNFPGNEARTGQVYSIAPQAMPLEGVLSQDATIAVHVEETGRVWPKVPIGSQVSVQVQQ